MGARGIYVPQHDLHRMLRQWLDEPPRFGEYRFAKCWGCGRRLFFGMWHVFFEEGQREAHLCRRCGRPYEIR